jgi:competence protein ComEA
MKRIRAAAHLRDVLRLTIVCLLVIAVSACGNLEKKYSSASLAPDAEVASSQTNGRLSINTASIAELEKLPGVGKVLAERIVRYREEHGPFRRAEHLLMVQGISDNKFRKIQPLITTD